jgi:hypothetical protein
LPLLCPGAGIDAARAKDAPLHPAGGSAEHRPGTAYVTRNFGYLVFDTLFAPDMISAAAVNVSIAGQPATTS